MATNISTFTRSATAKVLVIAVLTVMLFVPLMMIWALISERASRRDEVVREVSDVWGGRQTVGGFALSVPFETTTEDKGTVTRTPGRAIVLPTSLSIDAELTTEVRQRSIFAVNLYRTTFVATGTFVRPDFSRLGIVPSVVHWDRAVINVGVSDLRGVVSVTPLTWSDVAINLEPSGGEGPFGGGLRGLAALPANGADVPFRLEMVVAGSGGLMFLPSGAATQVSLRSPWPSPGFTGGLLPASHEIRPDGFNARWQSNYLSRPFPQAWIEGTIATRALDEQMTAAAFGLDLVTTVDHYQQTERAVKYGFLFIVLTFALFLVWELIERLRVHPIQYLLVGLALVVFYLLLLSLSEHVRFAPAYAVASCATVLLVAGYAGRILGTVRSGVAIAGWMGALYGLLFVLLRLEDLALLVGSVAIFLALAAAMYFTRGVDWYGTRDTDGGNG